MAGATTSVAAVMSSEPAANASGEPKPPARVKPHQLALVLGIAIGIFILVSGILPQITGWKNENPVHRTVFVNIPGPIQIAFYTVIPVMVIWGAFMFANRMKNWERGAPAQRHTTKKNVAQAAEGLPCRRVHADAAARRRRRPDALDDLLRVPGAARRHHGARDRPPAARGTQVPPRHAPTRRTRSSATPPASCSSSASCGRSCVATCSAVPHPHQVEARARGDPRHVLRRRRHRIRRRDVPHRPGGHARATSSGASSGTRSRTLVDGWSQGTLDTWHQWWWILHVASFIVFLAILPLTMLRHIFTSPLNMYLRTRTARRARCGRCRTSMETELESFGASTVEDFTWKQLLDLDACTMCGRCTSVCPAHATGKPLDPREIVLKSGEVMAATGSPVVSPPLGTDAEITISANSSVRADHPRGDLGLHHLQGVRRDLPGQHRDHRQDLRHAALPVADGVELPRRAGQRLPGDGEPEQPVGHEPGRARRLGRRHRRRHDRRPGRSARRPSTCTGSAAPARSTTRTRRSPRRWPSCCAAPGIDVVDPRPVGDVHRRLRSPLGQRVPVPDARQAERRDAQRHGREEDHHPVPALLQHAAERVPAARRQLRGHPPHASCSSS